MKKYSRVTYSVRCQIFALLQAKVSIPKIASQLGFHKTTIYRELKRNLTREKVHSPLTYRPFFANKEALKRRRRCRRKSTITGEVRDYVEKRLTLGWSPEQIAGRMKRDNEISVSYQSIYRFVYGSHFEMCLRKGRRRLRHLRGRRGPVPKPDWMKSISKRPKDCNERKSLGHWERDTMFAKNREAVLVLVDRKSRFTKIARLDEFNANAVADATLDLLSSAGKKVLSMTNDNGTEFMSRRQLGFDVYYCDPYTPQQRGTVENTIGLLRSYIKNKTNLDDVNLELLETMLNIRPRKTLGYLTPFEVFYKDEVALAK